MPVLNNPDFSDIYGLISVVSDADSHIEPIYNTYQSNILDSEDRVHILYMSENQDRQFDSEISHNLLNNSNKITIGPNPMPYGAEIIVRMDSGIQIDNLSINLYDIYGYFIKKIDIGEVNYTFENFNEFTLYPLDDSLPSGIYIFSFNIDGRIESKKIVYLK